MLNIVVFASRSGTNFQSIIDAAEAGKIDGRIRGLITDRPDIMAIERARNHDIDVAIIRPADFDTEKGFAETLLEKLNDWDTDLIALAGYVKKIPSKVIKHYSGRIVNIHPALLPKYGGKGFYGEKVHKAVIENDEKESGCTVHLVTEEYDKGPILGQRKVSVKESDDAATLAKRILKEEHKLYPEILAKLTSELKSKS